MLPSFKATLHLCLKLRRSSCKTSAGRSFQICTVLYSDPTKKKVRGGAMVNYGWLVLAFVKATFQAPSFVILIHREVLNPSHSNYRMPNSWVLMRSVTKHSRGKWPPTFSDPKEWYLFNSTSRREFPGIAEMTEILVTVNDIYWRSSAQRKLSNYSNCLKVLMYRISFTF